MGGGYQRGAPSGADVENRLARLRIRQLHQARTELSEEGDDGVVGLRSSSKHRRAFFGVVVHGAMVPVRGRSVQHTEYASGTTTRPPPQRRRPQLATRSSLRSVSTRRRATEPPSQQGWPLGNPAPDDRGRPESGSSCGTPVVVPPAGPGRRSSCGDRASSESGTFLCDCSSWAKPPIRRRVDSRRSREMGLDTPRP